MKTIFNFDLLSKILIFSLALSSLGCGAKKLSEKPLQWNPLFNGKDLENWQVKLTGHELNENYGNTFRVEDGLLKVRYDKYDDGFGEQFGHLFYEKPFSSYLVGVEYRFVGEQAANNPGGWAYRNSGIMIHGQDPATMKRDQDFPNSIEVQLLGGNGTDERPTANLCTPGTQFVQDGEVIKRHCTNSTSPTFHGDQWVRVEVLVLGDSIIAHYVNGEEVMGYQKPQTDAEKLLDRGTISLQSESHPIDFRKVEIVNLEKYQNNPQALQKSIEKLLSRKRVAKQ